MKLWRKISYVAVGGFALQLGCFNNFLDNAVANLIYDFILDGGLFTIFPDA